MCSCVLCNIVYTDIDDHGNRRGNTVRAFAQWRHLVALHEAMDGLHWMMCIELYYPCTMGITIVIDLAAFFYIVDYKLIYYSFMLTIQLNCFNRTLAQPLAHVSLILDWV
jgi:hypothetical protein